MKFAATIIAALAGMASADRIPLHHNPLSAADYISQKAQLVRRAERWGLGESVPVKDYMNTQYFVTVKLGSDEQEFTMVPDTGSSNLWAYSSNCHSVACRTHSKYNPKTSTSYEAEGNDFNITYGSGSIEGYTSKDVAKLGDISANMTFGEIQKVKGATFLVSPPALPRCCVWCVLAFAVSWALLASALLCARVCVGSGPPLSFVLCLCLGVLVCLFKSLKQMCLQA